MINRTNMLLLTAAAATAVLSFPSVGNAEPRETVFSARGDRREIEVPLCWEEIERDYEGVAFYRRKFQVPASWAGKTVRLHTADLGTMTIDEKKAVEVVIRPGEVDKSKSREHMVWLFALMLEPVK